MEIRISVAELSRALHMAQGVVQRKNTMPILSNVLLEASSNDGAPSLSLHVTDLDIGLQMHRSCEVLEPGSITVPARSLLDVVKMLAGPHVTLRTLPNQHLNVKSGRTNARLLALPAEEFPRAPDVSGISMHKIPSQLFSEMLQKTIYCASVDENRYNLTGVYFEPHPETKSMVLVSTDGHRLSRIQGKCEGQDFNWGHAVILPRKGLSEMMRLIDSDVANEDAHFEIGFSNNQAVVRRGNTTLNMRLVDGKFPDYQQVIPKISDKILRASRLDLLTSLKRVSVLATDRTQSVRLTVESNSVTVSCYNPDAGEVSDDVAVEYNGPKVEIGFNVRYIIEALASLSDNNIVMRFTDPLSPTLLTGTGDDRHLCVIMPMRM